MAINSKIILAKGIRLDKEYKNVLTYSESQLLAVMRDNTHLIYEASNYSFIDEFQNIICVQVPYGSCIALNYMAFQNPRYNNKWFFCFIDKVEYNSENSTNITFHIDSWATWYESLHFKNCYTIREHVSNDTVGLHTVREDLAVPEVVLDENAIVDTSMDSDIYIAVSSNWSPDSETGFDGILAYNKNVFGNNIYLFPLNDGGVYNLEQYLFIVGGQGHTDDIHAIFTIPSFLVPSGSYTSLTFTKTIALTEVTCACARIRYDSSYAYIPYTKDYTINKKTSFSDYTPKNNKLLCYPYNYLLATNNIGSTNIYKYEDFDSSSCVFELQGALSVGCSFRVVPKKYKSKGNSVNFKNNDEALILAKYPTCSWSADAYTNWLTQSAVNVSQRYLGEEATSVLTKAGEVVGFLGDKISGVTGSSLPSDVAGALGSFSKQNLLPEITGGNSSGDVNYAAGNQSITFMRMRAKKEYLEIIDDYFSRFGYKILRVKVPEINSRTYWNYVEIGSGETLVVGDVPQADLDIINKVAQRGFTIWHNHDNIGNYQLTNSIVS